MSLIQIALVLGICLLVSEASGPVHAYLDPGTGSMIFQVVLGGIVGGLAVLRLYWQRVKGFVLQRQNHDQSAFSKKQ